MQDSKNFSKNYEGLLPEEEAHLLELKRSVALDDAKPKIAKNFLSFVKYVWPEFIKGSHWEQTFNENYPSYSHCRSCN